MYPSLDVKIVSQELYNIVLHSKLDITGLDWETLSIFLGHKVDKEILNQLGLTPIMPTQKRSPKSPLDKEAYQWSENVPDSTQKQIMLALLAKQLVIFIMTNHTYTVGDEIFLQLLGGPIGLDFTRVLARLIMIIFDIRFEELMTANSLIEMKMQMRYVDDENFAVDVLMMTS